MSDLADALALSMLDPLCLATLPVRTPLPDVHWRKLNYPPMIVDPDALNPNHSTWLVQWGQDPKMENNPVQYTIRDADKGGHYVTGRTPRYPTGMPPAPPPVLYAGTLAGCLAFIQGEYDAVEKAKAERLAAQTRDEQVQREVKAVYDKHALPAPGEDDED